MQSILNKKFLIYGQWTYRVAWALEIVAATIGLATGLTLGYQAYAASQGTELSVGAIDLTLASAPFIMVALAELIKIPIATLMFAASWFWKPILAFFLLLLAIITFETVVFGLERASTQRQIKYDSVRNEVASLTTERQAMEAELARLSVSNEVDEAYAEIERVANNAVRELAEKRDDIMLIQERLDARMASSPAYVALGRQIGDLQADLDNVIARRDAEMRTRMDPFEAQRNSFVERIAKAREQGDLASVRRDQEQLARLRNPMPEILQRYDPNIQELESDLRRLRASQRNLPTDIEPEEQEVRRELEERISILERQRAEIDASWQARREQARVRLADAQERLADRDRRADELRERIGLLTSSAAERENERVIIAKTDQIRRLAASIYGGQPENVSDENASFVALVWFSSLGALAALAGPLTAIVALGLMRTAELRQSRQRRSLSNFLRRWLIHWRFRRVRKVPVTVEVPVEKVVKEILYVPILTDDPQALKSALDEDLPEDIARLLKTSFKTSKQRKVADGNPA